MRLNDSISPADTYQAEARDYLQSILETVTHNIEAPASRVPTKETYEEIAEFYDKYYVVLDNNTQLNSDIDPRKVFDISNHERRVLEFCLGSRSETRICVLHGHTGVGKSTLIRRVVYYIYPQIRHLTEAFIPIYIRLAPELIEEEHNPDVLVSYVQQIICEETYAFIKDTLVVNIADILRELNERGPLVGEFPPGVVSSAVAQGAEDWMHSFFKEAGARNNFLFNVIALLVRQKKRRLVLFIDDVDRLSRQMHTAVFMMMDKLAARGILSLVSMRTSTFENTSTNLLEYRDQRIELRLDPSLIEKILTHRVDLLQNKITLRSELPFRIRQYETVSGEKVIQSFYQLIRHPVAMKALVNLSNTNLKMLFLKLHLMSKSEAFSDTFVVRQLFEQDVLGDTDPAQSKIWIFYHLLLGNYAGTYRRDPEAHKAGLVNLFDCSVPLQNPWKHFIRLNILMYLYKKWELSRDPEDYIPVIELYAQIKNVVNSISIEGSLILDALWALVESELVFMGSCRRYKNREELQQDVFSDSIQLSLAGRFYLENLLHKVEYLYFIKDDINWRSDIDLADLGLRPAKRDYNRKAKFTDILTALGLLLREEYICLAQLSDHWCGIEGGEERLAAYRDQFSPYSTGDGQGLSFCLVLLRSYKKFVKSVLGDEYRNSDVENMIKELEQVSEENEGVSQAFIQA